MNAATQTTTQSASTRVSASARVCFSLYVVRHVPIGYHLLKVLQRFNPLVDPAKSRTKLSLVLLRWSMNLVDAFDKVVVELFEDNKL